MTSAKDIRDAVNAALIAHPGWEARPCYLGATPRDFIRPSFLIETPHVSVDKANCGILTLTAYVTVTIFLAVDDYYKSDMDSLLTAQLECLDIFRSGHLAVGSRDLTLRASTGGLSYEEGTAWVDIQVPYYDVVSDDSPPEPLMADVETKITRRD